jgi:hypothetical protein
MEQLISNLKEERPKTSVFIAVWLNSGLGPAFRISGNNVGGGICALVVGCH